METGNGNGLRERLTRDRICEAGLEAIDAGGLDALSMRNLARTLGVRASSLYYHFENKEALMTGIAESLYRKLGTPPSVGEWEDQVKAIFVQLREFILAHPRAAPLLIRDLPQSPVAKKRASVLLKIFLRAGLEPDVGAVLIGNLVALLVGHSMLAMWAREEIEPSDQPEAGEDERYDNEAARMWVRKVLEPTRLAEGSLEPQSQAGFVAGLDALIGGFTVRSV